MPTIGPSHRRGLRETSHSCLFNIIPYKPRGLAGNVGQKLIRPLSKCGHQVCGLASSPSKLPPETLAALERSEVCPGYDDITALDGACTGVDAVVCACGLDPRMQLDRQLLLPRPPRGLESKSTLLPAGMVIRASWSWASMTPTIPMYPSDTTSR